MYDMCDAGQSTVATLLGHVNASDKFGKIATSHSNFKIK